MDQAEIEPVRRLLAAGRIADATKAIDAALEKSPDAPLLLAYRAVMHMEAGDIDRAERELTELTARVAQPMDAETQAFAGRDREESRRPWRRIARDGGWPLRQAA